MLVLLAIPVIAAVAITHRFIQAVAPSNLLVRSVRSAAPRWAIAAALLGLAMTLLVTMHVVAYAVSAGAPGWLNLLVLVLAWDALKFGWLAVGVVVPAHRGGCATGAGARVADTAADFVGSAPCLTIPRCSVTTSLPFRRLRSARRRPSRTGSVDLIRKALDARGLTSMDDRQQAVEGAAGRAVPTLRDLTHDEAIRVLNRLGESGQRGGRSASLWESRDEDTWIDRM